MPIFVAPSGLDGGRAAGQGRVVVEVPGHDSGTRLELTDLVYAGRPLRQWLRKQGEIGQKKQREQTIRLRGKSF